MSSKPELYENNFYGVIGAGATHDHILRSPLNRGFIELYKQ